MKLQINLLLDKIPSKDSTKNRAELPIEDQVRHAVTLCDSGHESREEWEFLRRVNNALMKIPKLNKRQANLLKLITPCLRRHASASGGKIEMDSEKLSDAGALFNYEDKES